MDEPARAFLNRFKHNKSFQKYRSEFGLKLLGYIRNIHGKTFVILWYNSNNSTYQNRTIVTVLSDKTSKFYRCDIISNVSFVLRVMFRVDVYWPRSDTYPVSGKKY